MSRTSDKKIKQGITHDPILNYHLVIVKNYNVHSTQCKLYCLKFHVFVGNKCMLKELILLIYTNHTTY